MARGPAYPYVNLEDAVALARKTYDYTKRAPALIDAVVTNAWKASPTSSSSVKIVAALKYFGLLEDVPAPAGRPDAKLVKITDRAYRIIVDEESSLARKQAIADAALAPKAYQLCWSKWGKDMPPSMRSSLIFDDGFIESTVDGFIKDYKKTVEFSGLLSAQPDDGKQPDAKNGASKGASSIRVGDYIQWESGGVLLIAARQVKGISSDGQFLMVDGSDTGVPIHEATVVEKPADTSVQSSAHRPSGHQIPPPIKQEIGMRQEVFSMTEGAVTIQWPTVLSAESFEDFKDWLAILERKVKRSVQQEPAKQAPKNDEEDQ